MKTDRTSSPIFTGLCCNSPHYNLLNFLRDVHRLSRHIVVFTVFLLISVPRLLSSCQHGATWSTDIL